MMMMMSQQQPPQQPQQRVCAAEGTRRLATAIADGDVDTVADMLRAAAPEALMLTHADQDLSALGFTLLAGAPAVLQWMFRAFPETPNARVVGEGQQAHHLNTTPLGFVLGLLHRRRCPRKRALRDVARMLLAHGADARAPLANSFVWSQAPVAVRCSYLFFAVTAAHADAALVEAVVAAGGAFLSDSTESHRAVAHCLSRRGEAAPAFLRALVPVADRTRPPFIPEAAAAGIAALWAHQYAPAQPADIASEALDALRCLGLRLRTDPRALSSSSMAASDERRSLRTLCAHAALSKFGLPLETQNHIAALASAGVPRWSERLGSMRRAAERAAEEAAPARLVV